jgi:hypothetical protein
MPLVLASGIFVLGQGFRAGFANNGCVTVSGRVSLDVVMGREFQIGLER